LSELDKKKEKLHILYAIIDLFGSIQMISTLSVEAKHMLHFILEISPKLIFNY